MGSLNDARSVSLEESKSYLKVMQAIKRTALIHLAGLVPAVSDWRLKKLTGYHLWIHSIHINQMRLRLKEMRVLNPDKGLDAKIHDFDKFLKTAPHPSVLLQAIYGGLTHEMIEFHEKHVQQLLPVNDAPTLLMLRSIVSEEREMCREFMDLLEQSEEYEVELERHPWLVAFKTASRALLDELMLQTNQERSGNRLDDLIKLGSNRDILPVAEAARPKGFRKVDAFRPEKDDRTREEEVIFQFTNYVQEMNAAETIGSILYELEDMPWEMVFDLSRHLWDEVRHATMGEVRLQELGISLEDIPHGTLGYGSRQKLDPVIRFAQLTLVIEADSFPIKRKRHQGHIEAEDFLSAQALIYDMTDETMHVHYGQKWVPYLIEKSGMTLSVQELTEECRRIYEQIKPF